MDVRSGLVVERIKSAGRSSISAMRRICRATLTEGREMHVGKDIYFIIPKYPDHLQYMYICHSFLSTPVVFELQFELSRPIVRRKVAGKTT